MLAAAIIAFAAADVVAPEAGLMATTTLGVVLANQHRVPQHELTAFSEDVGYLILGSLFIVLGALVDLDALIEVLPRAIALIAVLVVIARPIAVWLSTVGAGLQRNDRLFLGWMAPRGIVAASVATVFSQAIIEAEGPNAPEPLPELVPIVFATVIVTVALYGLTATWVARKTRVAKVQPNGIAIVSNRPWSVDLAETLVNAEIPVLLVTGSRELQHEAFSRGILAYDRPIDSHDLDLTLDGVGIKHALLMTDDENFASLAAHHLTEHLGRANLYQVQADEEELFEMRGRPAFGDLTFAKLSAAVRAEGFAVTEVGDLGAGSLPLLSVSDNHTVSILSGKAPTDGKVVSVG